MSRIWYNMMRWFRDASKTARIGELETAIAKLAAEIAGVRRIAERTEAGVERVQQTLNGNHIAHAQCEAMQDGRWKEHSAEHRALADDLAELTQIVKRNAEDIRILSASITRIADRQRDKGD